MTEWSRFLSKANHSISSNSSLCPNQHCWRNWSWTLLWRPTRSPRPNTLKRRPFHHTELECKNVGSQEIPGVIGEFGLEVQNEARQRLAISPRESIDHSKYLTPSSNKEREDYTNGYYQMVNSEIRLIIFFVSKDVEAIYTQQKVDLELTVAQIMHSLLPCLGWN